MSGFAFTAGGERFQFADLKTLLAKATPLRSGDQLAGLAAGGKREPAHLAL
ncbi:ethanolamine ammonia-lyase subunit EutB, partial [Xanthomonas arboricola]|uniref:ethanolamine ammonia-lyase subunit EutB n=1 Tax=Xanthomonas arboricola TaxID=56448 RepID=UPI0021588625